MIYFYRTFGIVQGNEFEIPVDTMLELELACLWEETTLNNWLSENLLLTTLKFGGTM